MENPEENSDFQWVLAPATWLGLRGARDGAAGVKATNARRHAVTLNTLSTFPVVCGSPYGVPPPRTILQVQFSPGLGSGAVFRPAGSSLSVKAPKKPPTCQGFQPPTASRRLQPSESVNTNP